MHIHITHTHTHTHTYTHTHTHTHTLVPLKDSSTCKGSVSLLLVLWFTQIIWQRRHGPVTFQEGKRFLHIKTKHPHRDPKHFHLEHQGSCRNFSPPVLLEGQPPSHHQVGSKPHQDIIIAEGILVEQRFSNINYAQL